MMDDKQIPVADLINRDNIRKALKLFGNYEELGELELASRLTIIENYMHGDDTPTTKRRGLGLQKLLQEARDSLKPPGEQNKSQEEYLRDKTWRSYVLIEEYIKGTDQQIIGDTIGITREHVNRLTTQAIETITNRLYFLETQHRHRSPLPSVNFDAQSAEGAASEATKGDYLSDKSSYSTHTVGGRRFQRRLWSGKVVKFTSTRAALYTGIALFVLISSALIVIYWQQVKSKSAAVALPKWCDNFEQTLLDEQKWGLMEDEDGLVYVNGGTLNFEAAAPIDGETIGAELVSLPVGRLINRVTFTATLVSLAGAESASAGIRLILQNGQDFAVMLGSGSEGPEVEIYKCPNTDCNDEYERYQTNRLPIAVGIPMVVHVVNEKNVLDFTVGGIYYDQETIDARLNRMQYSMFAEPGSAFHVAIDKICVTYDE